MMMISSGLQDDNKQLMLGSGKPITDRILQQPTGLNDLTGPNSDLSDLNNQIINAQATQEISRLNQQISALTAKNHNLNA